MLKQLKSLVLLNFTRKQIKLTQENILTLEEIEGVNKKVEELYSQYKNAVEKGETSENFFAGVKSLKEDLF